MSSKKKSKMVKSEPKKKQEKKEENTLLIETNKRIQAHIIKMRKKHPGPHRDGYHNDETYPFCAKVRISTWRRVVLFAAREILFKSHAIDKLLEAGLDALDA